MCTKEQVHFGSIWKKLVVFNFSIFFIVKYALETHIGFLSAFFYFETQETKCRKSWYIKGKFMDVKNCFPSWVGPFHRRVSISKRFSEVEYSGYIPTTSTSSRSRTSFLALRAFFRPSISFFCMDFAPRILRSLTSSML